MSHETFGVNVQLGECFSLDNLLKAGVNTAEHVIVVKESSTDSEFHLADCSTILTVQKIHKYGLD